MNIGFSNGLRNQSGDPSLIQQINGIGITEQQAIIGFNRVPPDHNGAVGPQHVVSVLNHVMQIYDKSGNLIVTQQLEQLFGVLGGATTLPVDPNILYDEQSGRFVFVAFEVSGTTGGPVNPADDQVFLNIAVSKTSDPTDGWHVQSINSKTFIGGQNAWSDYPGVAVDGEAIYVTANMFDFDAGSDGARDFKGNRLWIIDKGDGAGGLYDGGAINFSVHDPVASATDLSGRGVSNATLMPARYSGDHEGESGIYLVTASGLSNGASELAQIIRVTDPLGTPDFTAQSILLGDISNENLNFLPQATQLGTGVTLASGDPRVNSGAAVWFDDKLYFTFSVAPKTGPDAGQTTTHWVELDALNPNALALIQQGNIGGEDIAPGTHTFESSINVNKDGSVLINYSASGPSVFPGAYFALRAADDPSGVFGPSQLLSAGQDWYFRNRAGEGISPQTLNRWGDFSGVSVDPVDGTTFWFFNQFADDRGSPNASGQDGRWRVTIGSARPTIQNFQFDASSTDENFYGGLGADGLQFNAAASATSLSVSAAVDGSIRGQFGAAATGLANAYFIETILFSGGPGDDVFTAVGSFADTDIGAVGFVVDGGGGNDELSAVSITSIVNVKFNGDAGRDTLTGGTGADTLSGNTGNDLLRGLGGNDTLAGGMGFDTLEGGAAADMLKGESGRDTVVGGDGADTLDGGTNNDRLDGGDGDDVLTGGVGFDTLRGASGDDTLNGNGGDDRMFGGVGADVANGGDGLDRIRPEAGNDTVNGGDGDDRIFGSFGFDSLRGNGGADLIDGDGGNDTLIGDAGNDTLIGNFGFDSLDGGVGFDVLEGAGGNDTLTGGGGNDTFRFALGDDNDRITDFAAGAGIEDVIELIDFGAAFDSFVEVQAAAFQLGGDVLIDFGGGDTIRLLNTNLGDLNQDDFVFG